MAARESVPPELFLAGYPPAIGDVAERLRDVVGTSISGSRTARG